MEEKSNFVFAPFWMPVGNPSRDLKEAGEYSTLKFRGKIWLIDFIFSCCDVISMAFKAMCLHEITDDMSTGIEVVHGLRGYSSIQGDWEEQVH